MKNQPHPSSLSLGNELIRFVFNGITVFPRNLAAPRIVAAFEISPRNSNAQCTKRRPRILAACGKGSSLLLRAYVRYWGETHMMRSTGILSVCHAVCLYVRSHSVYTRVLIQ